MSSPSVLPLLSVLLGLLELIALASAFGFLGLALQSRLAPDARASDALLDALLIAVGLALAVCELLGFAGLLTAPAVLAIALAGCALVLALFRNTALPACRARLGALREGIRSSPAAWVLLGFGLLLACRGIVRVPLAWDALTYHLTYASVWIQQGGFVPYEAGGVWEQYETFPKAGEVLFWLAMAPMRGDALVNLVNLPFWLGLALAFRCSARQLGASAPRADLYMLPLLLHPTFTAYVTPTYVEMQSACYAVAAVAYALRARSDLRALPLLLLAVCLACATKITALSWWALVVVWLLVLAERHRVGPVARAALGAPALLGVLVVAPWYLANAARCANPIYPAPLPFATSGPAAGSLELARTLTSSSIVALGNFGELFDLLATAPWTVRWPQGPGALVLWLAPASLLLAVCARDAARRKQSLALLAVAAFLSMIYLLSPHNGLFIESNSRFLALACALCMLSMLCAHDGRVPGLSALALLGAAVITALALWPTDLWRLLAFAPPAAHPAAWLTAGASLALLAAQFVRPGRGVRLAAAGCALVLLPAVALALGERERDRAVDLAREHDLHPVPLPSPLWYEAAKLRESRLAVVVTGYHGADGWFLYPLFGARLDNRVQYVDIERDAAPVCQRRGRLRDQPDRQAWLQRLEARGITHLLLVGQPVEAEWVKQEGARFASLARHDCSELFAVRRWAAPGSPQVAVGR